MRLLTSDDGLILDNPLLAGEQSGPIVVSASPASAAAPLVPERRAGPASLFSFSGNVTHEYDPAHPNDYEEICR